MNNIISEIESNKIDLEKKVDYHLTVSKRLNDYVSSDSLWNTLKYETGIQAVFQLMDKGIYNPNLRSGAWNSAMLSGTVNSFDFKQLNILSDIYQLQEEGPKSVWKVIAQALVATDSYDPKNAKRLAHMLNTAFLQLHYQEKSLIDSYEYALENLQTSN
ncbi:MAG: hypothetical protein AAF693_18465 [Bacteroidota bacterium]